MNNRDSDRQWLFTRRAALLAGGQFSLLTALVGRMYYLQVVESERYQMLAEENRINMRLLPPSRGRILDRFGVPIAINQQNYRILIKSENTPDVPAVLDRLAKTGVPTRAEVTDAAMSERAECVMLNKGPHVLEALAVLDDILHRMESHQSKKSSLLRRLRSW